MKKGCFLSFVFISTIVIGIVFYIADKHGDEILELGKEKIKNIAFESVNEHFDRLAFNDYKDSLKVLWSDAYRQSKVMDFEEGIDYLAVVSSQIEKIARDSIVKPDEYNKIREIINNETNR